MLSIATWNVNSIKARLPNVVEWLQHASPDVVLLQELKCETAAFPYSEIEALGYKAAVSGQKSWNGVAILANRPIEDVALGLPGDGADTQSRYIEATVAGCRIASLYLPNGNPVESEKYPYKLGWMARLHDHAARLLETERPIVLGGDYNVIPEAIDVFDTRGWENDALFRMETRREFRRILHLGMTEAFRVLHPDSRAYSFWDYQSGCWPLDKGLRIDHFLLSPQAADRLSGCVIDKEPRGRPKASDHTPVILSLEETV